MLLGSTENIPAPSPRLIHSSYFRGALIPASGDAPGKGPHTTQESLHQTEETTLLPRDAVGTR